MKWQVWGREDNDGSTYSLFKEGQVLADGTLMADFVARGEDTERLYLEFETPEEDLPDGFGPSAEVEEVMRHCRVANLMARMYWEGLMEGREDPSRTCPVHSGQVHGKEAEELRKGIEKILDGRSAQEARNGVDYGEDFEDLVDDLYALLDTVDARDSLAHVEQTLVSEADRLRKGIEEAVAEMRRRASMGGSANDWTLQDGIVQLQAILSLSDNAHRMPSTPGPSDHAP